MTESKHTEITLTVPVEICERLKVVSARKGMPVEEYCELAVTVELVNDEEKSSAKPSNQRLTPLELKARRKARFGDYVFPGEAADLIREARAIRDAQMEKW